uniref:Major facilitator superfamily (MFS) profile domain-containing protein n=1 Tax=Panagrolaimus sp. JU765 TaxID=591449 RepID=A0AC34Q8K6_9BILA
MDENPNFKTNWKSIWIANLVAFISSVASGSISPIVWPYLKQIDVSVNETLFGFVRGGNFLVLMIVLLISGFIVNKSGNVRLLILSKILFTASATFFYLMGIIPKAYVYFFIASELLSGFAGGVGSVFRIYVAMSSTEADRGKACGIMQLSAAAGIILGPALQLGFSQIPYPGVKLFWIFYINLFTAPIFLAIFTAIVAPIEKIKKVSVNKLSVIVLILTKMILELVNVNFSTIAPMYAMAAFQLTSTDAVKLQSLMTALIGLLSVAICFGYVYFKLNSRLV